MTEDGQGRKKRGKGIRAHRLPRENVPRKCTMLILALQVEVSTSIRHFTFTWELEGENLGGTTEKWLTTLMDARLRSFPKCTTFFPFHFIAFAHPPVQKSTWNRCSIWKKKSPQKTLRIYVGINLLIAIQFYRCKIILG